MSSLPQEYAALLDRLLAKVAVEAKDPKADLAAFWPMKGDLFELGRGLMVIGRAPNGWENKWQPEYMVETSARAQVISHVRQFAEAPQAMAWVETREGDPGYNTRRSAFWRAVRRVVDDNWPEAFDAPGWSRRLCWSNLYKLAPYEQGNPPAWLARLQLEHCIKLLQLELDTWRPKWVLVLTGDDWYGPFVDSLTGFRAEPAAPRDSLIQQVGYYQDQVWVLAKHPQGRRKAGLAEEAGKLFQAHRSKEMEADHDSLA